MQPWKLWLGCVFYNNVHIQSLFLGKFDKILQAKKITWNTAPLVESGIKQCTHSVNFQAIWHGY